MKYYFYESAREIIETQLAKLQPLIEEATKAEWLNGSQKWFYARELSQQDEIYRETLNHIDGGMSPEELVFKTLVSCAVDGSSAEFAKFRSHLLLSVIDFQVPGESPIEELPTTK